MKISISVEGRISTIYPLEDSFDRKPTSVDVLLIEDGRTTNKTLDANELLADVARLVPDGTRVVITVETDRD